MERILLIEDDLSLIHISLSTLLQRAIRASARKGSYHPIGAFPG